MTLDNLTHTFKKLFDEKLISYWKSNRRLLVLSVSNFDIELNNNANDGLV